MSSRSPVSSAALLLAAMVFSGSAMAVKVDPMPKSLRDAGATSVGAQPTGAVPLATNVINVSGIQSFFEFGETGNVILNINIGPNSAVNGIGWDVIVSAFAPSYLSELTVSFEDSAQTDGVFLTLGPDDTNPGLNQAYNSGGIVDLIPLGFNFNVGPDGILRVEFFEDFDDTEVNPDGIWNSGSLTIQYAPIPEPATYGMMALGALGVLAAARRRKAA